MYEMYVKGDEGKERLKSVNERRRRRRRARGGAVKVMRVGKQRVRGEESTRRSVRCSCRYSIIRPV